MSLIEYDDIYGLNKKDYIYTLYMNVYTTNNVIAKPSELFFDVYENTGDVEFAIPVDYSNATVDD